VSSQRAKSRCPGNTFRSWYVPCALLFICTTGCDLPGRPKASDQSLAANQERSFDTLYRGNCAGCHGLHGKLGPAPPLNDKLFRSLISEDDLRLIIAAGRPGTLMPAFGQKSGGQLTAEQVLVLAQGIKSHWGPAEPVPAGTPPLRAGPDKPDRGTSHDAGWKVFALACASCHGDQGEGSKTAGAIHDPDVVALLSDQALRRLIITGRPDLDMPDSSDGTGRPDGFKPLTSQEVTELVSLLGLWREGVGPTATEKGK
jgi:cytochrome c oxidase cbb3-type subunit III